MPQLLSEVGAKDMSGAVLGEIRGLATVVEQAFSAQERRLQLLSEQLAQVTWMLDSPVPEVSTSKLVDRPDGDEKPEEGERLANRSRNLVGSYPLHTDDPDSDKGERLANQSRNLVGSYPLHTDDPDSDKLSHWRYKVEVADGESKLPPIDGDQEVDEVSSPGISQAVQAAHTAVQQTLQAHFKFSAREATVSQLWTADPTMMEQWREQGRFERIVGVYDRFMAIKEPPRSGFLARFLTRGTPIFLGVIMCNAIWMVWSVNFEVANPAEKPPPKFQTVEIVFVAIYTLELALRLLVHRLYFFINDDMGWNLVDFSLVFYSILELLFLGDAIERLSFLRMLRLFKAGKILRLFRVIRFLQELRVMLMCLLGSIWKLFWSIAMMIITFYMFSMVFVQGVVSYRSSNMDGISVNDEVIVEAFGSLERSLLTLFKVSTGESWVPFYEAMIPAGEFYSFLFLFFMAFSQIALLNVLTGIFVESAMKLAEPEPEQKAQEKVVEDQKLASDLRRLTMRELDLVSDETPFPMELLMDRLSGTRLGSFLHYIGVDINEIHHFIVLGAEVTGNKRIDARTFVRACMRVKGWATSLDLQHVLLELKVLHRETNTTLEKVCETLSKSPKNGPRVGKQFDGCDIWQRSHLGLASEAPSG